MQNHIKVKLNLYKFLINFKRVPNKTKPPDKEACFQKKNVVLKEKTVS